MNSGGLLGSSRWIPHSLVTRHSHTNLEFDSVVTMIVTLVVNIWTQNYLDVFFVQTGFENCCDLRNIFSEHFLQYSKRMSEPSLTVVKMTFHVSDIPYQNNQDLSKMILIVCNNT